LEPVTRRVPVQKRSKERFERILATTGEMIATQGVERLGMRELADESGVPVATIYQYFSNREEVIATFLEREMEKLDIAMATAILKLERIDMGTLIDTIADVHVNYHRKNPAAVEVWFSGRAGYAVADRIRRQNATLGIWLRGGLVGCGLMQPDAPELGGPLVVRQFDRMFEFVFLEQRTRKQQDEIVAMHRRSATAFLEFYATDLNKEGVPTADFIAALGPPPDYVEDSD
jgi:AcrR family transcriptional regulator